MWPPFSSLKDLSLAYSEYLGPAVRAYPLSCWSLVLHCNRLGVLDFHLLPALQAIGFHLTPFLKTLWPKNIT